MRPSGRDTITLISARNLLPGTVRMVVEGQVIAETVSTSRAGTSSCP